MEGSNPFCGIQELPKGGSQMISDLYERHLMESNDVKVIKNDFGFVEYKVRGRECFLAEIYVIPEKRNGGIARALIEELSKVAKDSRCEVITANIFLAHKNNRKTIRAALSVGFNITAAERGTLFLQMEVN